MTDVELGSEELRQFFCLQTELQEASKNKTRQGDEQVLSVIIELECIAMHTKQPALANRCRTVIAQYAETAPARRA